MMEDKIYNVFSFLSMVFGVLFFVSAFLLFFDPFSKGAFFFYFFSGVSLIVFHCYLAKMFAYVLSPIIKLCIFILKN